MAWQQEINCRTECASTHQETQAVTSWVTTESNAIPTTSTGREQQARRQCPASVCDGFGRWHHCAHQMLSLIHYWQEFQLYLQLSMTWSVVVPFLRSSVSWDIHGCFGLHSTVSSPLAACFIAAVSVSTNQSLSPISFAFCSLSSCDLSPAVQILAVE